MPYLPVLGSKAALVAMISCIAVTINPSLRWVLGLNYPPNGWGDSGNNSISPISNLAPSVSSFVVSSSVLRLPSLSNGPIPPSADYSFISSIQSVLNPDTLSVLASVYSYDTSLHALAYKLVAKKVCGIVAPLDEEFHITRSLPDDPLSRLKSLPLHPPNFIPGVRFTQERADNVDLDPTNWLLLDKVKLIHWIILKHEMAFTWIPTECGCLNERYFPPVKSPTIPHTPRVSQDIPIPPSMWADTIQIMTDRIASGIYEPSAAACYTYRSERLPRFC